MITENEKQQIASHFNEAMDHEDLYNTQAARFLNLNPCYITWIRNEKYWSDISQAAWDRFNKWHQGREKLSEFRIPEGEVIWEKKNNKKIEFSVKGKDLAAVLDNESPEEHSPEAISTSPEEPVKQKRKYNRHDQGEGKSVKIILQKKEIEELNSRIDQLDQTMKEVRSNNELLLEENNRLGKLVEDLSKKVFVIEDENIAVMLHDIKDLQEGIGHLVTLSKQDSKLSIILFPKYIYKS
jgi:predicted RNase H-like nuclease (RuvC/YqgF family)